MTVSLPGELQAFVEEQVRAGHYATVDEAIVAAVARLQSESEFAQEEVAELRAKVDVGIAEADAGNFVEFTAEEVIAERRAAWGRKGQGK